MTQPEYEQKKRECWEEFCKDNGLHADGKMFAATDNDFSQFFDRAYALGKEKETITQEEIENAAEKFADGIRIPASFPGVMVPFINGLAHDAYLQGAKDCLGKQEKDADTVIQGWVGRDQDGNLPLFVGSKPYKQEGMDYWSVPHGRPLEYLNLNPALFPDITWESDPEPVEITIKRKNHE